jgi:beta-glucosidase
LERGLVKLESIDAAVRRVLQLKARLGLFEDPYRRCGAPGAIAAIGARRQSQDLAYEANCRSMVLLKNADGVLPLGQGPRKIAVIGPLADAKGEAPDKAATGVASGKPIAVLDGLRSALPQAEIAYAQGCGVERIAAGDRSQARDLARQSDIVVLCLGETRAMSGEAGSRGHPGLTEAQCRLARAVLAQRKPVIVLLFSGRPLVLPDWLAKKAKALLAVWFPGSEAARAFGDVLSGRFNPTGRLTMSWPAEIGQIPIFFAERPTGRPRAEKDHYTSKYLDMPNEPRFPFGHGLSYSRIELGSPRVDRSVLRAGEWVEITADVANRGPLAGEETVFLFIRDRVSSITRPLLELKDFQKVALAAGESKTVRFRLAAADFGFIGRDLAPKLEAGTFDIHVGQSAAPDRLLGAGIELVA